MPEYIEYPITARALENFDVIEEMYIDLSNADKIIDQSIYKKVKKVKKLFINYNENKFTNPKALHLFHYFLNENKADIIIFPLYKNIIKEALKKLNIPVNPVRETVRETNIVFLYKESLITDEEDKENIENKKKKFNISFNEKLESFINPNKFTAKKIITKERSQTALTTIQENLKSEFWPARSSSDGSINKTQDSLYRGALRKNYNKMKKPVELNKKRSKQRSISDPATQFETNESHQAENLSKSASFVQNNHLYSSLFENRVIFDFNNYMSKTNKETSLYNKDLCIGYNSISIEIDQNINDFYNRDKNLFLSNLEKALKDFKDISILIITFNPDFEKSSIGILLYLLKNFKFNLIDINTYKLLSCDNSNDLEHKNLWIIILNAIKKFNTNACLNFNKANPNTIKRLTELTELTELIDFQYPVVYFNQKRFNHLNELYKEPSGSFHTIQESQRRESFLTFTSNRRLSITLKGIDSLSIDINDFLSESSISNLLAIKKYQENQEEISFLTILSIEKKDQIDKITQNAASLPVKRLNFKIEDIRKALSILKTLAEKSNIKEIYFPTLKFNTKKDLENLINIILESNITTLYLYGNNIKKTEVLDAFKLINKTKLTTLVLSKNYINTKEKLKKLISFLKENKGDKIKHPPKIKKLFLTENEINIKECRKELDQLQDIIEDLYIEGTFKKPIKYVRSLSFFAKLKQQLFKIRSKIATIRIQIKILFRKKGTQTIFIEQKDLIYQEQIDFIKNTITNNNLNTLNLSLGRKPKDPEKQKKLNNNINSIITLPKIQYLKLCFTSQDHIKDIITNLAYNQLSFLHIQCKNKPNIETLKTIIKDVDLNTLSLSNNKIKNFPASSYINKNIKSLDLSYNRINEKKDLEDLIRHIKNSKIETLNLSYNQISNKELLTWLIKELSKTSVKEIDLRGNLNNYQELEKELKRQFENEDEISLERIILDNKTISLKKESTELQEGQEKNEEIKLQFSKKIRTDNNYRNSLLRESNQNALCI